LIETWALCTLLAASVQSLRTAGQRHLVNEVSPLAATLVRYLFGLPLATIYFLFLWLESESLTPVFKPSFFAMIVLGGILQIIATILMILLFSERNFAVGSAYIRCEILFTAIIGTIFFTELIPMMGWIAIVISAFGLMIISLAKINGPINIWSRSAFLGLSAGLCFSITSLLVRSASLSLEVGPVIAAAITLVSMVALQTIVCSAWLLLYKSNEFMLIFDRWRLSLFVGVTSIIGSSAWFTAFALERAAYVKTLGQIELVITVLISIFFFKEIPNRIEFCGIVFLIVGVLLLLTF